MITKVVFKTIFRGVCNYMSKRTKLKDRILPYYTGGEEIFNMVTHIVGGAVGISFFVLCVVKSAIIGSGFGVFSSIVFGASMILLYTMSSIYHGLRHQGAKKVFQIIDHCTIYFLIAGTYTPMALCALMRVDAAVAWFIFFLERLLLSLCVTLTAIDLKKYKSFSMACYIIMGWAIIIAIDKIYFALGGTGFALLLGGGVAYTVGFIFYKIGKKKKYFHSIFHLFVLLGSILQGLSVLIYAIR